MSKQLPLFPNAAPGATRARGRAALVQDFVAQAQARGCTHLEVSLHGHLFVTPEAVGRIPDIAVYLPLDSPVLMAVLLCKTPSKALQIAGADHGEHPAAA